MAYCVGKNTDSFLYITNIPINECTSLVVMTADEYQQTQVSFDATTISSLFFFAFGMVLLSYKSAWIVGTLKRLIGYI